MAYNQFVLFSNTLFLDFTSRYVALPHTSKHKNILSRINGNPRKNSRRLKDVEQL